MSLSPPNPPRGNNIEPSTRLTDLYALGLLSKDQKGILADQLEVNDGEVIRHLMMETSDKIVQLAGDLLYERNLITNIDGKCDAN
mgnify:CR=1 FL=1